MKYLIVLLMLLAVPCYAQTYVKVGNDKIKATEQIERSETLTIEEIDHEIAGIDKDIDNITVQYNNLKDVFNARKAKYQAMRQNAIDMGIKPVVKGDMTIVTEGTN